VANRGIDIFGDIPVQYCAEIPVLETEVDFVSIVGGMREELKIIKELLMELNGKIERI
jgi:hypothetical protein